MTINNTLYQREVKGCGISFIKEVKYVRLFKRC